MIKCAIFDFDGTIVDTEKVWCDIAAEILKEQGCGKELTYDIWKERYFGNPSVSKSIIKDYGLNISEEEFRKQRNEMFISFCKEDSIINHNFLHNLRNKEIIRDLRSLSKRTGRCYLVTGSSQNAVENALNILGIKDLFKGCYYHIGDKREIYKEIAEKEGLEFKDIVLYEDSHDNIGLGKELGMLTFLVG